MNLSVVFEFAVNGVSLIRVGFFTRAAFAQRQGVRNDFDSNRPIESDNRGPLHHDDVETADDGRASAD